ncbi:hypothetical protein AB0I28_06970 [Phytomonospora sp. NPDC050363]|uniref:hypothetical protein n=1 Tax=Phytomonospora sp. NPDC050363 TaxID=3155642 RepID=UPI00340D9543
MADKSELLAAELTDLWRAGTVTLPLVAEAYAGATGSLHSVGYLEKHFLTNPNSYYDYFPAGPGPTEKKTIFNLASPDEKFVYEKRPKNSKQYREWVEAKEKDAALIGSLALGGIYEQWSEVRSLLQEALGRTARNFVDGGAALVFIATEYARTDEDAAMIMRREAHELETAPDLDQAPGEIPPIVHPDDPHPEDMPHGSAPPTVRW